ncbi:MAG: sugar transporter [Mucilaginibacter sp.]|nr:sugar transporter [Mucilaginibacter sp.]
MKKLFLIAITSLLCARVYAQTETPVKWSYLNCTEETVSLKASIRSGWHINSFHVGNMAPVKPSFEYMPAKFYETKEPVAEPNSLSKFENAFSSNTTHFEMEPALNSVIIWRSPKTTSEFDKLSYIPWDNIKHLPPENPDFTILVSK